VQIGGK
jgi:peptidoglycan hydrolase CwlO-like protein